MLPRLKLLIEELAGFKMPLHIGRACCCDHCKKRSCQLFMKNRDLFCRVPGQSSDQTSFDVFGFSGIYVTLFSLLRMYLIKKRPPCRYGYLSTAVLSLEEREEEYLAYTVSRKHTALCFFRACFSPLRQNSCRLKFS